MNKCKGENISINETLLRLVQPYSNTLLEQMKQTLIESPNTRIVHVWNGYHLNDVEIFKLCEQCKLDLVIEELEFPDINHAAMYVCKYQLRRLDLSIEYKKYLIGQQYFFEHAISSAAKPNNPQCSIAEKIASELFIAAGTVRKYGQYAMAMNVIFDQDMVFAKSILSGKARLSHENTIELSRLRPEEIKAVAKASMEEKVEHITLSYIRNEVKWSHIQSRRPISRRERSEEKARNKAQIRQMPEYDPDAEVNSLCLTIDSWISSMQRVKNSESFPNITKVANLRLMKKLSVLEHTINTIQELLVERTSYNG
ncbi:Phosphoenolpyruvate carboxylase, type 1 [Ruminococcaceae bacterium YRB3002]|nr:Phosphoenolpyruvate carboxylase, type 1 [Ruminococcaceae bacterium YRB3002]